MRIIYKTLLLPYYIRSKKQIVVLLLSLCFANMTAAAQEMTNTAPNINFNFGLSCAFGKPINRIGVFAKISAQNDWLYTHLGVNAYYNFSNYGPLSPTLEWQPYVGLAVAYGAPRSEPINPFSLQQIPTNRRYAIGYDWRFYFDKNDTSQSTGLFSFYAHQFSLHTENDAFTLGKKGDKYRTGMIALRYLQGNYQYEIRSVLWHGNTKGRSTKKVYETDYPCRFGYCDFTENQYGHLSHGVLAFQVSQNLGQGQIAHLGLGIDSERVRHFLQNQLIHDMILIPEKWNKARNVHYPMLDENGMPYLFLEHQKIRKDKLYFSLGLNENGWY